MTRKEAIEAGLSIYDDGYPCKRGHRSGRYTVNYGCVECQAIQTKRINAEMSPQRVASRLARKRKLSRQKAAAKRAAEAPAKASEERRVKQLMVELGLDLLTVRQEAKDAGEQFYFTGKPCSKGHICKRWVSGGCYECQLVLRRSNMAKARVERKDELNTRKRAEYHRSKDRRAPARKRYALANAEKLRARARRYAKEKPELVREIGATRRARKRNATPPWLTKEMRAEIKAMHAEANALKAQFGVRFDVDHIVPLDGRHVSGLHVPWNMRVITHAENISRPKVFSEPHLGLAMPLGLGCGATIECYQL